MKESALLKGLIYLGTAVISFLILLPTIADIKKDTYDNPNSRFYHSEPKSTVQPIKSNETSDSESQYTTVYSGPTTCYKKTFTNDNKLKYTFVSEAFGKLVMTANKKAFNFYYNGREVFTRNEYDSYMDSGGGEVGYTSHNGVEAHRFISDKLIYIEVGESGYHYEIKNYKAN